MSNVFSRLSSLSSVSNLNGLPRALGLGIEQDPDLALERVQPDPGIAFHEGRKLGLAEVNRFLQSTTEHFASGPDLAPQAHLQGEAASSNQVPTRTKERDGAAGAVTQRGKALVHTPPFGLRQTAVPGLTSKD